MRNGKRNSRLAIASWLSLAAGCQTLPIAASCPPPPPAPQAIVEYASPATNLIEDSVLRSLRLREAISEALRKASGQPM